MPGPKVFWIGQEDRAEFSRPDSRKGRLYPGQTLSRHLLASLRAREGDVFSFSNPDAGANYRGTLISRDPCVLELEAIQSRDVTHDPLPRLGVVFSPLKGDVLSDVLSMAVMSGIDILQPMVADRSIVRWAERDGWDSREKRFEGVIREKSQLAGRTTRMQVAPPLPLKSFLEKRETDFFLWFDEDPEGSCAPTEILDAFRHFPVTRWRERTIWSVVGPEGGWSERDRSCLRKPEEEGRVFRISLGERVYSGEMALLASILFLGTFLSPMLSPEGSRKVHDTLPPGEQ